MKELALPLAAAYCALMLLAGCATMKQSDTSRTGTEQLLISSAADRALDKLDLRPLSGARVFVEAKYLDCVDKNYILVGLHQRLLRHGATLAEKPDHADVVLQVASGGVGTDREELFVGVPEIPLPPPSPLSIPRIALMTRTKMMGTAKLKVAAYDVQSKRPVIHSGAAIARSDHKNWSVFGAGPLQSGSLPDELAAAGEKDSLLDMATEMTAAWSRLPAP